ncbi:hypothetical protein E2C01_064895 [Portunus trituberculatus]|uniref:Uncharacterized protein n=1 Tax=Portunus trituberculatus TaxID=210409 RepID=A0A5B7HE99_PORTR|nr:hypothetical protein [Portunus trituberculatus]
MVRGDAAQIPNNTTSLGPRVVWRAWLPESCSVAGVRDKLLLQLVPLGCCRCCSSPGSPCK